MKISSSLLWLKVAAPLALLAYCSWHVAAPMLHGDLFDTRNFVNNAVLAVSGLFIFKFFIFDLADSVDDQGDHFIVRRGWKVERIAIENIAWVGFRAIRPPRVTLHLFQASRLGQSISFYPADSKLQIALHNESDLVVGLNKRLALAKTMAAS